MSEKESRYEEFGCPRMGHNVTIHKEFVVRRTCGRIDAKVMSFFDCNGASECGVGTTSGFSTTFDWSKCVHPDR